MLLERGDDNPDQRDTKYGRTPVSWALRGGHLAVARMLLERRGVNPGTEYRRTPLSWMQLPPIWPLRFSSLRRKADIRPDSTRSTLPLSVNPYFIIASFVCLFAFLIYILPFSLITWLRSKGSV
ncbi:hypothetical protein HOY80DRAFT_982546, partial [Tuber brumale]